MGKRTVLNANVTDIEKRREPSKHYVYIIHVTWSDKSVNVIYRRYSAFFDFQVKLLASFPEEAGANNPSSRCIPFLPGKKLFGRSHVREVALKRLSPLDEYCQSLVKLPSKISDSSLVVEFFTPTPEDVSPPAPDGESRRDKDIDSISEPIQAEQYQVLSDYKKQQKNEVDLTAGDLVEVFEKNDNGWWFVTINDQHGWAPGTFLQKPDGSDEDEETVIPGNDETYITNNAYKAQADDEISFETGVLVNIEQKSLDGWWKVSYQGKQGWAPATYLQIYKGPSGVTAKPPTQAIGNVMLLKGGDNTSRPPLPKPGSAPFGSGTGLGAGTPPPLPARNDENESDNIYTNYDTSTEAKPTPPRRATVRKSARQSARRGATRNKLKPKRVVEHYAIEDFEGAAGEGSLSFREGDRVEVLEENDGGWWFVKIDGKEGWAPSTYIEKREVASSGGSGSALGKSQLASLDEETGESGPPALPARPTFGSGGTGAFKPVQKSNKATPPPVDRSSSPASQRKPIPSSSSTDSTDGGGDLMAALRNRFEKTSAGETSRPKPKPPKSQSQPYCNRDALYVTTASYQNDENDGLSFREGERVEVIKKDGSGWWMVRIGAMEGWAPSTFLEKA